MKLTALTLVLPSVLSPPCEAVRKQASRFSPNAPASVQPYSHGVALAPGMKGQLHALPQKMRDAAEVTSGPGAERQARDWVADYFQGDDTEASEFPMNFGFDELDGTASVSHLGMQDQGSAAHGRIEWTDGGNPLLSWRVRPAPEKGLAGSASVEEKVERKHMKESQVRSVPGSKRRSQTQDVDSFRGDDTEASEFPMNFGFDELEGVASVSHLGMQDQGNAAHGRIEWTDGGNPLLAWRVRPAPEKGLTGGARVDVEKKVERKHRKESQVRSVLGSKRRSQTQDVDSFRGDDTEASEFPMNFGFDELEGVASVSHLGMQDQGKAAHGRIEWTDGASPLLSWRVRPAPEKGLSGSARVEEKVEREHVKESRTRSGPGAKRRSQTRDADSFRGDDTEASEFPMNFGFDDLDPMASVSHLGMKDQGKAAHGKIDWTDEDGSPLFKWRVHGI